MITPTKAITTSNNITLIGDIFFLDNRYQQRITNTAVKNPGYTPSNVFCNSKKGLVAPAAVIVNEVLILTQVAATAPITIPPNIVIDSLNASY